MGRILVREPSPVLFRVFVLSLDLQLQDGQFTVPRGEHVVGTGNQFTEVEVRSALTCQTDLINGAVPLLAHRTFVKPSTEEGDTLRAHSETSIEVAGCIALPELLVNGKHFGFDRSRFNRVLQRWGGRTNGLVEGEAAACGPAKPPMKRGACGSG